MSIEVAWSRRRSPNAAPTTDELGFSLMEFSFVDGRRLEKMVLRDVTTCSSWQRVPFQSPSYLTTVEVWYERDTDNVFIYAEPDSNTQAKLP